MSLDYEQLTKVYLKIRDKRSDIKKSYDAADAELKSKLEQIEGAMLKFLIDNKIDSSRTEAGTFYKQENIIPRGDDWMAFYDWVMEDVSRLDAFERRIKKQFIVDYMEEHKALAEEAGSDEEPKDILPPGVSVYRENVVRVRKPS